MVQTLISDGIVSLLLGYLLGTIPFGLVLTRLAGLGDVRKIGSGNIGATNVLRTGNKVLAGLTLAGDVLKGTAGVYLGWWWGQEIGALAGGLGAFLGHLFPVWLGFKGGKGVATYIGVLLGLAWPAALAFCASWLVVAVLARFSSLSALIGSLAAPVYLAATGQTALAAIVGLMSLIVIMRHKANISRLLAGTEPRIGAKS